MGFDGVKATSPVPLDELIADRDVAIVVCCGSGGVGKTTTSAAIAVRAAEAGRHVVVLTIDPARRLAQSLGLEALDNTPRPVPGVRGGRLDAMMLDFKRTFDDVVRAGTSPEKARAILENPFYVTLSSSFAGTSEYMAMEKLGQLHAAAVAGEAPWDLIVVDTPPSRSALDFLDAPQRLSAFLDGRFLRLLTAPARAGGRAYLKAITGAVGGLTAVLTKVLGDSLVADVQSFLTATDTMFGGFRDRARDTYDLLADPRTRFVVVASARPESLREASYFVRRLQDDRMPLAGLVVNRVQAAAELDADQAERAAQRQTSSTLTKALLRLQAQRARQRAADLAQVAAFEQQHPEVPVTQVPDLATDVHDLAGLRTVGALLGEG